MPWLLDFMEKTFQFLPDDLNATVVEESNEFEVVVLEGDKIGSCGGSESNNQWP
jgi:hypothetical protein